MSDQKHPRRPAMLEPSQAEEIQGDEDPAARSEVAHRSAAIIIGREDVEADPDIVNRLVAVINTEGVEAVCELWSRSPASTLPGTLWRLYLIREWYLRDPGTVEYRYREGLAAPAKCFSSGGGESVDLEAVMQDLRALLLGRFDGSLVKLLEKTGVLLRILAAGATFGPRWVDSNDSDLAFQITRRAGALVRTAEEIEAAAERARNNALD